MTGDGRRAVVRCVGGVPHGQERRFATVASMTAGPRPAIGDHPPSSVVAVVDGSGVRVESAGVSIDGRLLTWRWLRDHATDESSFDRKATQRLTPPEVIAADAIVTPDDVTVEVDHERSGGSTLVVRWPTGAVAELPIDGLRALVGDPGAQAVSATRAPDARPWDRGVMGHRHRPMNFADFHDGDHGLVAALDRIWVDGFVLVTGVPADHASTREVLERFGYVRSTIFGDLWEFSSDGLLDDLASTPVEITPHTDGTYSHDAPGLLALHCHDYDAVGGGNVFVDGAELTERLRESRPDLFDVMTTVEIPGRYLGDGVDLVARRPPLRCDGDRLVQISYNHHDRAPFWLPEPEMSAVFDGLTEIDRLARSPELQFDVDLRPGDMVVFDNWRLLHGRRSFVGRRRMAGGYVNREDLESTTRRSLAGR